MDRTGLNKYWTGPDRLDRLPTLTFSKIVKVYFSIFAHLSPEITNSLFLLKPIIYIFITQFSKRTIWYCRALSEEINYYFRGVASIKAGCANAAQSFFSVSTVWLFVSVVYLSTYVWSSCVSPHQNNLTKLDSHCLNSWSICVIDFYLELKRQTSKWATK